MSKYKRIDLSERISIQASIERELSLEQTAKNVLIDRLVLFIGK